MWGVVPHNTVKMEFVFFRELNIVLMVFSGKTPYDFSTFLKDNNCPKIRV